MNPFHRKRFLPEADENRGNGNENPCKEEPLNNGVQSRSLDSLLPSTVVVFGFILGILLGLFYRWRRSNGPSRRISPIRILAEQETHEENHNQLQLDQNPVLFINTNGLKQSDIDSIPVFRYRKDEGVTEGTECSVCLSEFREDERLKLLPKCNHAFHVACIDTWLGAHKSCPFCRAPIEVSSDAGVVNGSDCLPGNSRNPNQVDHEETSNRKGGCGNSSSRVLSESSSTAVVRNAADEAEIAELKNPKPKNNSRKKPIMRSFSSARLSSEGHLDMKRSSSFGGMFLKQDLNA